MADIAITASRVACVEAQDEQTLPAAEVITAGQIVRIDSNGKFTPANASSETEADWYGIAINGAIAAGYAVRAVRKGKVNIGDGMTSLDYNAKVWLSHTDGVLADASVLRNEAQTITITGTPTGGTFTLTFTDEDGTTYTTGTIAYDATAATVLTAIRALAAIENDDVSATGGALPGTPVVVTFAGKYTGKDVALMTANGASLTGGTAPAVAVTTSTTPRVKRVIGRVSPVFGAGATADKLLAIGPDLS